MVELETFPSLGFEFWMKGLRGDMVVLITRNKGEVVGI